MSIQSMGVLVLGGHSFSGSIQTDSSGNIVAWNFDGCLTEIVDCEDRHVGTSSLNGDVALLGNAFGFGPIGAWTITTITTIPEPSTLATFISGTLLLVGLVRRRRL